MFRCKALGVFCCISAVSLLSNHTASASTTKVTLAGFTIDTAYTGSIVDVGSGVKFFNESTQIGSNQFIIDYFNSYPGMPDLTPGRVVSANGYAGNGKVFLPYDLSFSMSFPTPVSEVDMFAGYATNGADSALTLNAYDSDGTLLGSSAILAPTFASFVDKPLAFSAGSNKISSVTIVPTDISDDVGQISFTTSVPEPASLTGVAAVATALGLRRARRKCGQ